MADPGRWDAAAAVARCPIIPWRGRVWRAHHRKYAATDVGGALRYSARYHRAPDYFPPGETWPAPYCAVTYGVCLAETLRHVTPDLLPTLNQRRLSEIAVDLSAMLDCRDLDALGVSVERLFHDLDYTTGQELAAAAIHRGCEALLIPSATRLPDPNLIIFPDSCRSTSRIAIVGFVDPSLYVQR